jgi:hypothetical protein
MFSSSFSRRRLSAKFSIKRAPHVHSRSPWEAKGLSAFTSSTAIAVSCPAISELYVHQSLFEFDQSTMSSTCPSINAPCSAQAFLAAGSPLNFQSSSSRMFAIALPSEAKDASVCTWSTPIVVSYPGIPELFINAPVTGDWIRRNMHSGTARSTASIDVCNPEPQSAPHLSAPLEFKEVQRCRVTCKALMRSQHEVAAEDGVRLKEQVVAVVRMSMQVHSPGSLHIVLHNAGGQPPYLLQNRTAQDFVVRQHKTQDQWRVLRAYSATGFSWPFLSSADASTISPSFAQGQNLQLEFVSMIAVYLALVFAANLKYV